MIILYVGWRINPRVFICLTLELIQMYQKQRHIPDKILKQLFNLNNQKRALKLFRMQKWNEGFQRILKICDSHAIFMGE